MATALWNKQNITIKSRTGWTIEAYAPLLKHRWPLYARSPKQALMKLSQLPPSTIHAILEHLYANTPVARTNLPAFKACKIVEKLPYVSTYHQDLINLLHDTESTDFEFYPATSEEKLHVHKFFLYARCGFFRDMLRENPESSEYHSTHMSRSSLEIFVIYLYTGDLEILDVPSLVDLIGAGSRYQIDFLVMSALRKNLNKDNCQATLERADALGLTDVVDFINEQTHN